MLIHYSFLSCGMASEIITYGSNLRTCTSLIYDGERADIGRLDEISPNHADLDQSRRRYPLVKTLKLIE
jgi:hypothetical protein